MKLLHEKMLKTSKIQQQIVKCITLITSLQCVVLQETLGAGVHVDVI